MTHLSPGGDTRLASSHLTRVTTPSRLDLGIDPLQLRAAIASRRAALAALETAMVADCEQQAARGAGQNVTDRRPHDLGQADVGPLSRRRGGPRARLHTADAAAAR